MGEHRVEEVADEQQLRAFMRRLLDDVQALDDMLAAGMFESGVRRIGAEQEMFLVDAAGGPAPLAMEMLRVLDDDAFTTELALFNLEANLKPFHLRGTCLARLEKEIARLVERAREAARSLGGDIALTGILPTIRLQDLGLESMTPFKRYKALNKVMRQLRGGEFRTMIKGLDELQISHDNILLEACNTSFQVHFQVGADEFARLYNLSQAVVAPVLAAAANSPLLLQQRLWQESRIALFQQSIDIRSAAHQSRGRRTRVSFGERWLDDSVIEIFREDISRLRVVLAADVTEDSRALVARGEVPELAALRTYNGTVYRWNRPVYGIHGGKAHLRIENRVLPSGPTPADEVANAAFYFGLMSQALEAYGPIHEAMRFDMAKGNFLAAARHGLSAQMTWTRGREVKARDLILDELLPLARDGLAAKRVDPADIDRYLGIVEERARSGQSGAVWSVASWDAMGEAGVRKEERARALVRAMRAAVLSGDPVHRWPLAEHREEHREWGSFRTVGQLMSTDLFTVRPQDLVDLAASMMRWEHIRHVPVEDDEGRLVGMLSYRDLLGLVGRADGGQVAVADLMKREVVTVAPTTPTLEAIRTMRAARVSCLPVVDQGKLVGILSESDFLDVAREVFERQLAVPGPEREPA